MESKVRQKSIHSRFDTEAHVKKSASSTESSEGDLDDVESSCGNGSNSVEGSMSEENSIWSDQDLFCNQIMDANEEEHRDGMALLGL